MFSEKTLLLKAVNNQTGCCTKATFSGCHESTGTCQAAQQTSSGRSGKLLIKLILSSRTNIVFLTPGMRDKHGARGWPALDQDAHPQPEQDCFPRLRHQLSLTTGARTLNHEPGWHPRPHSPTKDVFQGVSERCFNALHCNVFNVFPGNQGVSLTSYSNPMPWPRWWWWAMVGLASKYISLSKCC